MQSPLRSSRFATSQFIGAPGFEPGTSCSRSRRATRLRYAPLWGLGIGRWGWGKPHSDFDSPIPNCHIPTPSTYAP